MWSRRNVLINVKQQIQLETKASPRRQCDTGRI